MLLARSLSLELVSLWSQFIQDWPIFGLAFHIRLPSQMDLVFSTFELLRLSSIGQIK